MCGIVGAVSKRDISFSLLNGLRKLEYRGYDSAGIAVINQNNDIERTRRLGKVQFLADALDKNPISGCIGIAHTRWATHGKPAEINAHPHLSDHIAIVHNGIIENHEVLKTHLEECGFVFTSATDSEVIAHLINWEQRKTNDLLKAVQNTLPKLRGSYALVVMDKNNPDRLIAARSGSPIVIGLGDDENYIASDSIALQHLADKLIYLDEGDICILRQDKIEIIDKKGEVATRTSIDNDVHCEQDVNDKGQYRHFMEKEIFSQPDAIRNTLAGRLHKNSIHLGELDAPPAEIMKKIEHVQIIACGTSFNSGAVARYWFEALAGVSCDIEIASEFRYRESVTRKNSLFITLSQSGETADTLAALTLAKTKDYLTTLAICNVAGSSLIRGSDYGFLTKAGTEIGVASTKAFTTQLCALLLLVTAIGKENGHIQTAQYEEIINALHSLPDAITKALGSESKLVQIAQDFNDKHHTLFLGRGVFYPIAMEAALKLKEISYIHAESYAAGELKHGPLALVDKNMPVVVIAPNDGLFEKVKSNIEEVRARGGILYVFTHEDSVLDADENLKHIILPKVSEIIAPIFYTVPMQLLSYHIALIKGTDVDQPRNLAKSVTTE